MNDGALHDAYRRGSIGVQRMARENSSHEEAVGGVLEDKVAKHQQASAESGRSATLSGMQKLHEQQVKHQAKKAGLGTNALKERETSISHDHLERYLKDTVRRSLCCGGSGVLEGVRCRRDGDEREGGGGGGEEEGWCVDAGENWEDGEGGEGATSLRPPLLEREGTSGDVSV